MSNSKSFQSKLRLVLVVFFSLFLLAVSVKISHANCIPGTKIYDHWIADKTICPNSGLACEYEIWEEKHNNAICIGDDIMTTLTECRIRESEDPNNFPVPWWWPKLLGGDTLRGPCFQVVGSAPCSGPQETFEVCIWWQYINNWGEEEACDFGECFFCEDLNGDEIISYGIPECGLAVSTCPAKSETK